VIYFVHKLSTYYLFSKAIAGCPPGSSSSRTARQLRANCPDFITKDRWSPNLPNVNPMDYHV